MRSALSDSFDTPRAKRVLADLIKGASIHIIIASFDMDIRGLETMTKLLSKKEDKTVSTARNLFLVR